MLIKKLKDKRWMFAYRKLMSKYPYEEALLYIENHKPLPKWLVSELRGVK